MSLVVGRVFQVVDNRRWIDARNAPCISDSGTIHSHIYYVLLSSWFIGVADELKLKALPAVSTQVALYKYSTI